ncbi:uncharacterized protein [Parasteatoda tepidariorum]|nr:transcription factor A, mitochondrial isoform X2 [Parasteatoda tepidariorum]
MLFVKEKRQELLKETPVLGNQDQIRILARKWMNLSAESKKPYELQARERTLLYGEEHKKYYENLSEQQKEDLSKQKSEKRLARRVYRLNKALRESGFPKHARSPYALFVHSLASEDKTENTKDFLKHAAEKWKSLPEKEKKSFEKQAMDDKERYLLEIAGWKEKLLKEGNAKLLKDFAELKYGGKSLISKMDEMDTKKATKTKSRKKEKSSSGKENE